MGISIKDVKMKSKKEIYEEYERLKWMDLPENKIEEEKIYSRYKALKWVLGLGDGD